jgi:hypothetical protein
MKRKGVRLCMSALLAAAVFAAPASALTNVRPAVREPLHVAVLLTFKEKNIKAAMAKISEAKAVPNKTPEETNMISVVEGVIAEAAKGDLRPAQP